MSDKEATTQISYKNEVLRKLIHLSSLWMVGAIYLLNHQHAVILFSLVFASMVGFEILRRYSVIGKKITQLCLGRILRQHESAQGRPHLTGAFYVTLAVLMALLIFSKPVAMSAIVIMLLADTAAALVGRKFGTHKIGDKSWEGSIAFFIVSFLILKLSPLWGLDLTMIEVLVLSVMASLVELVSGYLKMDDNITIVLGAGAMISLWPLVF